MAAVMVELADTLVSQLNLQNWSLAAKACRGWRPIEDRESADDPTIVIVPTADVATKISRSKRSHRITLELTVQRQHGGRSGEEDPVARQDPIAGLVDEVRSYLQANAVEGIDWAANVVGDVAVELDADRLDQGIFAMRIEAQFLLHR